MSDSFCILPWIHLHTWPNGKVYPCCITPDQMPVGDLSKNTMAEIWNSPKLKDIRVKMLAGEKPESCNRCYDQEKYTPFSNRMRMNYVFADKTPIVKNTESDGTLNEMSLYYWDFRFSNICNFKCRSCGPQLSSGWYEDSKKIFGKLPDDCNFPIPTVDLWEQIEPHFDCVEEIYFAGGEPLIMEQHYRILDKLIELKKFDVKIRYNTNLSKLTYKKKNVLDYWKQFKNVEIWASLDSFADRGEYIRKGTDWKQIEKNIMNIRDTCPHIDFSVSATVGILNAYDITDFIRYMTSSGFVDLSKYMLNSIVTPDYLRIQVLPDTHKKILTARYKDFIDEMQSHNTTRQFTSLIEYMNAEDFTSYLPELKHTTYMLDEIRSENFNSIFPEFKDLFDGV